MKRLVVLSFLTALLFACNQESDTLAEEVKLLMHTVSETQGLGIFYELVEAERKEADFIPLIGQAEEELEASRLALEAIEISSEEAKLIQANYLQALEKNKQALLMIKKNKINDQTEADYKKLIKEASKIQQKAVDSCLNHLKIDKEDL